MTPTRASVYVGLALVLVAWLAGAAGLSVTANPPEPQGRRADLSSTQLLADDIQAQAARLRGRLAAAPAPRQPVRNPFAFAARPARPAAVAAAAVKPLDQLPARPGEPPLQLLGVAGRDTAAGVVRTAVITADSDEVFMLVEGDALGGRYRVKTIGADVVELTDLVTGATRQLSLR